METPKWLYEQERNSWQIELIISGGMLYTLWTLPRYFSYELQKAFITADFSATYAILFFSTLILSRALLIGFGVNLLLRALWLAYLGVHYAFPNGIDYKRLKYSKEFEERFEKDHDALNRILKIEKYCSLTYSLSIIISICAAGALLIVAAVYYLILENIIPQSVYDNPNIGYILLLLVLLVSFGFLDRIVFAGLKGKSKLQSFFYPISKWISYSNLSFLFKYEWNSLLSNISRWKIHGTTAIYFFIAFIISLNDFGFTKMFNINVGYNLLDHRQFKNPTTGALINNDEYDEYIKENSLILKSSIPSEIISGNFLPLFITYDINFDKTFNYLFTKNKIPREWKDIKTKAAFDKSSLKINQVFNECFDITINEENIDSINWHYREHPITKQLGFHSKLDIHHLKRGEYTLNVRFNKQENGDTSQIHHLRKIIFWRDG